MTAFGNRDANVHPLRLPPISGPLTSLIGCSKWRHRGAAGLALPTRIPGYAASPRVRLRRPPRAARPRSLPADAARTSFAPFRRRVRRDALWGMARQGRVGPATGDNRRVVRRSLDLVGGDGGDRVGHGDPERFLRVRQFRQQRPFRRRLRDPPVASISAPAGSGRRRPRYGRAHGRTEGAHDLEGLVAKRRNGNLPPRLPTYWRRVGARSHAVEPRECRARHVCLTRFAFTARGLDVMRYYWAPLFGRFRLVEFEDVK